MGAVISAGQAVYASLRVTRRELLKIPPRERQRYLIFDAEGEGMEEASVLGHLRRLRRLLSWLHSYAASSTWIEAAWDTGERLPDGWIVCNVCGRGTPPPCIGSSGGCDDCRIAAMSRRRATMLPASPSGAAINSLLRGAESAEICREPQIRLGLRRTRISKSRR